MIEQQFSCSRILLAFIVIASLTIVSRGASHAEELSSQVAENDNLRPFTVADSIAMTHFEIPAEGAPTNVPMSPDGKKFFVVTERGILEKNWREYSLLVYDLNHLNQEPFLAAQFNTSSNRPGISEPQWLGNGQISFLGELPGGVPQVYFVDASTGNRKKITSERFGVLSSAVSKDQKELVYYGLRDEVEPGTKYKEDHGFAVTEERLTDLVTGTWRRPLIVAHLHVKDVVSGKTRVLSSQMFTRRDPRIWVSPNGRYAIAERVPSSVPTSWTSYQDPFVKRYSEEWLAHKGIPDGLAETVLVDIVTGEIRPLMRAPSSVDHSLTTVIWSANSHSAVISSTLLPLEAEDQSELARRMAHPVIAAVDVPSGTARRVIDMPSEDSWEIRPTQLANEFTVEAWKRAPGGDYVAHSRVHQFRYEAGEWKEEKITDNDSEPQITIQQALDQWPVLVKVDRATHHQSVILDPNPQFKQFRFGRREVINWTGKLGEALTGGLVYPTDYVPGTRYPLVIQTHGFAPQEFLLDGSFTTAMAAQELANKGIVVLQLPQSPLEIGANCDRGPSTQSQIESAVDYLDHIGLIDRERVGLVGFSTTGFNVRHALVNSTYHFAAAISAEGNDWGYWSYVVGGNWNGWMAQSECPYGGPPWNGNWDPWMKKSISFNYDKIHTPLRLESDSNDDYAGVLNEWENFIALKRLHKPVELIYIPHGTHILVKPWDRLTSQQGTVDWMLFWLKSEEDPDPAKAEQYARWHELRTLQEADDKQFGNKASN